MFIIKVHLKNISKSALEEEEEVAGIKGFPLKYKIISHKLNDFFILDSLGEVNNMSGFFFSVFIESFVTSLKDQLFQDFLCLPLRKTF